MKFLKHNPPEALGLHIDGDRVRVAHLRRTKQGIALIKVDSLALKNPMDAASQEDIPDPAAEAEDILGLEQETTTLSTAELEEKEEGGNTEVLYELLSHFPVKRCKLALSLMESSVFYTDCTAVENLTAKTSKTSYWKRARRNGATIPRAYHILKWK